MMSYMILYTTSESENHMTRYALNLPNDLKRDAERLAKQQGVSLNQFILWSVAEKVGGLMQGFDDPDFPSITYRRGASGTLSPVLRGTGIRVQTIALASQNNTSVEIAEDYDLSPTQVQEALEFYNAHRVEIDAHIQAETALEPKDE
jgi:uncharacterized protein (DUF433 family)